MSAQDIGPARLTIQCGSNLEGLHGGGAHRGTHPPLPQVYAQAEEVGGHGLVIK